MTTLNGVKETLERHLGEQGLDDGQAEQLKDELRALYQTLKDTETEYAEAVAGPVSKLVRPSLLNQELFLQEAIEFHSRPTGIKCFLCHGRGVLGKPAAMAKSVKAPMLVRSLSGKFAHDTSFGELWFFKNDLDKWEVFSGPCVELLEQAYQEGSGSIVRFGSGDRAQFVDTTEMTLKKRCSTADDDANSNEYEYRDVRRLSAQEAEAEAMATDGNLLLPGSWIYQRGDGGWGCFDQSTQERLETSFTALQSSNGKFGPESPTVTIYGPQHEYKVDIADPKNMTMDILEAESWMGGGDPNSTRRRQLMRLPSDSSQWDEQEGQCWVCLGTGRQSQWLSNLVVQRDNPEEYRCQICFDVGKVRCHLNSLGLRHAYQLFDPISVRAIDRMQPLLLVRRPLILSCFPYMPPAHFHLLHDLTAMTVSEAPCKQ